MKRKVLYLLSSLMLTACTPNDQESTNLLELDQGVSTSLILYADQTQEVEAISFKALDKWQAVINYIDQEEGKATASEQWLTLSASQGKAGTNSITLTLLLNTSASERRAKIQISCGNSVVRIVVAQKAETQTGESFAAVEIEDAVFRAYIIANFDTNNSGQMEAAEMLRISEIYIADPAIKSISGIEYCTNLHSVVIENQTIPLFDFSKFEQLVNLSLIRPQSKSVKIVAPSLYSLMLGGVGDDVKLDIGALPQLRTISLVWDTDPKHIDLSKHPELEALNLQEVTMDKLDGSQFPKLQSISLYDSELGELKISNPELDHLWVANSRVPRIDLSGSPKVTSDRLGFSGENYIEYLHLGQIEFPIDNTGKPQLDIHTSAVNFTVVSSKLTALGVQGTLMSGLDVSQCKVLEQLNLSDYSFDPLDPQRKVIEGSLAVKATDQLERMNINGSGFNVLDLTASKSVAYMRVEGHAAKSFSLKGAQALQEIGLWNSSRVESIDISNCLALTYMESHFLTALKLLDVSNCTALTEAMVSQSQTLDRLTFKGCPVLNRLICKTNGIKVLDVTGCSKLATLWCSGNKMKTLDLSTCDIFNDVYIFPHFYPLQCAMPSLETLYLKVGDKVNGINVYRMDQYIHPSTKIDYK